VAREFEGQQEEPIRITIGFNGSADSEAALIAVTSRTWPPGCEARVICVGTNPGPSIDTAEARLKAAGLVSSTVFRDGDASTALIKEAEDWNAASIFVGTRNIHGFQHLLHGSVSAAVAAGALCSVEVVRPTKSTA
jgi:hypothetical protein